MINEYILVFTYIYLTALTLICDRKFHAVLLQQLSDRYTYSCICEPPLMMAYEGGPKALGKKNLVNLSTNSNLKLELL